MKIMGTWSLRETGNGPLKTSGLWIRHTAGAMAIALCLSLQATAAPGDIDEQIREKQKALQDTIEVYRFLQLFEDPRIWVVQLPNLPVVYPVSSDMLKMAVGVAFYQEVLSGKMTRKECNERVASTIREIEKSDKAFKAELKERLAEKKREIDKLRTEIAALQKRKSLPPPAERSKEATATARAFILDATNWTQIKLSEYGFTGTFKQQGEGEWMGSWPGGCDKSTFRLISRTSTKIEGMGLFNIVLERTDDCRFSPGLRAQYQLLADDLGTTVTLKGKRIVTNPGTLESMAWLKGNITEVTGSATKQ